MVVEDLQSKKENRINSLAPDKVHPLVHLYNHSANNSQSPMISVIMPAFNEEKAVGPLIDRTEKVLQKITNNYEIIVIDDGSNDQTLDICCEKRVTIIHNQYNWGKGYALREGFKHARGDIIITMDSDGEHNPNEIPLIIQPIIENTVDVVLGTRFIRYNHQPVTTAINTLGNKLFNFLIRCLTNRKFTDSQCGFRAFRKKIIDNLQFNSNRYSIETEMLIALIKKQIRIREVSISSPVTYYRRSNINRILDGLLIFFRIFKSSLK